MTSNDSNIFSSSIEDVTMEEKEEFESDEENTDYLNIDKPLDAIV
jgi:hypothetical protein